METEILTKLFSSKILVEKTEWESLKEAQRSQLKEILHNVQPIVKLAKTKTLVKFVTEDGTYITPNVYPLAQLDFSLQDKTVKLVHQTVQLVKMETHVKLVAQTFTTITETVSEPAQKDGSPKEETVSMTQNNATKLNSSLNVTIQVTN